MLGIYETKIVKREKVEGRPIYNSTTQTSTFSVGVRMRISKIKDLNSRMCYLSKSIVRR